MSYLKFQKIEYISESRISEGSRFELDWKKIPHKRDKWAFKLNVLAQELNLLAMASAQSTQCEMLS